MRFRVVLSFAASVFGGAALFLGLAAIPSASARAAQGLSPTAYHLIMGNPSDAKTNLANKDNYLLREQYFTMSYNDAKGTPNWVSWHLSSDYLGTAKRRNRFTSDALLPDELSHITHNDYTNSGFQRGHMCPHSDRAANTDMSFATFVMSNVVPQSSACNEGSWESLEAYGRYLVKEKGKELFIIAGPIGRGGEGENSKTHEQVRADTIADGKITVPEKVFKVIMVVEDPENGSNPTKWVNDDTRLIAVIMPNDMSVKWDNWPQYRVSVKDVEEATGLNFFSAVGDKIKDKKSEKDTVKIPKLPKTHGHPE
jgi:endonuclease G